MHHVVRHAAACAMTFLPVAAAAQGFGAIAAQLGEARRVAATDSARAIALADSAHAAAPGHPQVVYSRAITYALAGHVEGAREGVRRLLRWDARYAQRLLRDSTMRAVRAAFDTLEIARVAEAAGRAVSPGAPWATIDEPDLVPEGMTYDPRTRAVLVGSMHKRKILAIAPDGRVSERVAPGTAGLGSVVGIHVDARTGTLWATSNPRYDTPTDSTPARLYAFDAATGAFRASYAPDGAGPFFLNDLTTAPDGSVYVTDTQGARVWRLAPGATQLERFVAAGPLLAPNGITVSDDGRHLFVADADHVRVVSLADGRWWRLAEPDSVNAAGIDGLAFTGNALVGHHPLAFWRVARYELNAGRTAIVRRELIEANTPDGRTSTTGEVADGWYVFLGNTQLDRMNARTIDRATMEPVRLYRVHLPAR